MALATLGVVFLVGLLGGIHCIGMCGGVASAMAINKDSGSRSWTLQLAFNLGRISSYALAGAIAGAAGALSWFVRDLLPLQSAMYLVANLILIGFGLYLCGITRYVAGLERIGASLWSLLRPGLRFVMPANTWPRAWAFGALWGWIPCGLVYSMLATAVLTGDAVRGAAVMIAFGLGTLPNLLFAGALIRYLAARPLGKHIRHVAAGLAVGMGLLGLARLPNLAEHAAGGIFCISPER
jgi:sulfite exporter TauE/SafE